MNLRLTIFGESHGKAIGLVLDGLPPGLELDLEKLSSEMARRAPGKSPLSTARKESDAFEIQSGFFNGRTTGTPFCAVIKNSDEHSSDYSALKDKMRPSHADYAGFIRYKGFGDYRGGGHFSGRLTAPVVLAGAIAKQALSPEGITVGAHILSIGDIKEKNFDPMGEKNGTLEALAKLPFPVLDEEVGKAMQAEILKAKAEGDSVGGVVEVMAEGLPAGLGEPFFDSLESRLSHAVFSAPAVKAVEFGDGFAIALKKGSEANDELYFENERVSAYSNHNGGITGGITNGMPVVFRAGIKPTASIAKEQRTVDVGRKANAALTVSGRHDPCIVPRAVPVLEAVTAWTVWDFLLEAKKWESQK